MKEEKRPSFVILHSIKQHVPLLSSISSLILAKKGWRAVGSSHGSFNICSVFPLRLPSPLMPSVLLSVLCDSRLSAFSPHWLCVFVKYHYYCCRIAASMLHNNRHCCVRDKTQVPLTSEENRITSLRRKTALPTCNRKSILSFLLLVCDSSRVIVRLIP